MRVTHWLLTRRRYFDFRSTSEETEAKHLRNDDGSRTRQKAVPSPRYPLPHPSFPARPRPTPFPHPPWPARPVPTVTWTLSPPRQLRSEKPPPPVALPTWRHRPPRCRRSLGGGTVPAPVSRLVCPGVTGPCDHVPSGGNLECFETPPGTIVTSDWGFPQTRPSPRLMHLVGSY